VERAWGTDIFDHEPDPDAIASWESFDPTKETPSAEVPSLPESDTLPAADSSDLPGGVDYAFHLPPTSSEFSTVEALTGSPETNSLPELMDPEPLPDLNFAPEEFSFPLTSDEDELDDWSFSMLEDQPQGDPLQFSTDPTESNDSTDYALMSPDDMISDPEGGSSNTFSGFAEGFGDIIA
jgi:hypothetical protein